MQTYRTHIASMTSYHIKADGKPLDAEALDRVEHTHRKNVVFSPEVATMLADCLDCGQKFAQIAFWYACDVSRRGLDATEPELPDELSSGRLALDCIKEQIMLERRESLAKTGRPKKASAEQAATVPAQEVAAPAPTASQQSAGKAVRPAPHRFTMINCDSYLFEGMRRASNISHDDPVTADRCRATYDETIMSFLEGGDPDGSLPQRTTADAIMERTGLTDRLRAVALAGLIRRGLHHAETIRGYRISNRTGVHIGIGGEDDMRTTEAPTPTRSCAERAIRDCGADISQGPDGVSLEVLSAIIAKLNKPAPADAITTDTDAPA